MSATNTPSPAGQATAKPLPRRAPINPLVSRKPQPKRPQQQAPLRQPVHPGASMKNGANGHTLPGARPAPTQLRPNQVQKPGVEDAEHIDIPIYTTKRELLENLRHHVMRFLPSGSSKLNDVDITNEKDFPRPVKLHRRDPRATTQMQWREGGEVAEESKPNGMDERDKERLEALKAERKAEREANQAQMAPVAKAAQQHGKRDKFQKKTEQVFQVNQDKAHKVKDFQLRYEEALPWHIEDFDGKNTWAGTYEGAMSDCHVMMVQVPNGQGGHYFRMVPVEKWYKFVAKNQFKALSIEEAEARMSKRVKDPRWFMETQKASEQAQKEQSARQKLYTRKGERGERHVKAEGDGEEGAEVAADIDDIDYNYEEAFADDEENALFEGGEDEAKEAEDRIKREQREANIFELKEQKDYDKEEEEEKRKAQEEKKLAKKVRKALMKQEKNYVYEEDSDENPYTSESDSEDSHSESQKEEEKKKKEEEKQQADKGKGAVTAATATDKPSSTPSTPSKTMKISDPLRKGILKRPGSPNLSDASGSESSRVKKLKKKHPNGIDSIAPPSRPTSPANAATSDAEMSDGSKQAKKLKLRLGQGSRPATPSGSRPGSPVPAAASSASAAAANAQVALPTDEQIRARIPEKGIALAALLKSFSKEQQQNPQFISLIKGNARWDKATKMLYRKTDV